MLLGDSSRGVVRPGCAREDRGEIRDQLMPFVVEPVIGDAQRARSHAENAPVSGAVALLLTPVAVVAAAVELDDEVELGPEAIDRLLSDEHLGDRRREALLVQEPVEIGG